MNGPGVSPFGGERISRSTVYGALFNHTGTQRRPMIAEGCHSLVDGGGKAGKGKVVTFKILPQLEMAPASNGPFVDNRNGVLVPTLYLYRYVSRTSSHGQKYRCYLFVGYWFVLF